MIVFNKEVPLEDLGNGVTRKVLSYSENIMSVEVYFKKGAVGKLHSHFHEQIGYVVSGSLEVEIEGEEKKVLTTGDTYYIPPNIKHGVLALEKTLLLDIFTPMREDFIK